MRHTDAHRVTAEFLGTAALMTVVVGSGIVTSNGGAASVQLFQHSIAVGVGLVALILIFGPVSGAHFNPVVTIADWWFDGLPAQRAVRYVGAQIVGAVAGTVATNAMFGADALTVSDNARDGLGMVGGEAVATAGLLLVIFALVHTGRTGAVPGAVGAWIGGAIFFTVSASFANPAVTLARMFTDTYTGIDPASVPAFLAGQAIGTAAAIALIRWLYQPSRQQAQDVVVPHDDVSDTPVPEKAGAPGATP